MGCGSQEHPHAARRTRPSAFCEKAKPLKRETDILFIAAFQAPFVQEDIDILSKHFRVKTLIGHGFGQVLKIALGVLRADVVYCWFGSVYASVAVMIAGWIGIKSVIAIGGVDISKDERLNYGIWTSGWKSKFVRYAFRHASRLLVSDLSMKAAAMRLAEYSGANIVYVPPALDSEFWKPLGVKEEHILTVASAANHQRMRLKGFDILTEAARRLPQFTFHVVGVDPTVTFELQPPANMTFYPARPRKELLPFYQSAKIYCQPSVHEALCYTLREAMLCECIPVASEVGGMTTAVSGIGVLVPPENVDALVGGLLRAMRMTHEAGEKGRARMVALYAKEKREAELPRLVEGLGS
ncbi:MAG TPA: glycosyltransferase family 4 protein [Bacteroidota bacterium]|nr:glycosyltransferase family 4 protein [Bacteroidota bacterium]